LRTFSNAPHIEEAITSTNNLIIGEVRPALAANKEKLDAIQSAVNGMVGTTADLDNRVKALQSHQESVDEEHRHLQQSVDAIQNALIGKGLEKPR
jgi:peptidoglycan hydrolase CwlO-like protein